MKQPKPCPKCGSKAKAYVSEGFGRAFLMCANMTCGFSSAEVSVDKLKTAIAEQSGWGVEEVKDADTN